MAGSWEIKAARQVLCAILTREMTSMAWSMGFKRLIVPGNGDNIVPLAGMPFDHARNMACEQTLSGGFDWLFFLDDDVITPPDAILRLIAHNKPIVSGVYYRRSPPIGLPVIMELTTIGTTIAEVVRASMLENFAFA